MLQRKIRKVIKDRIIALRRDAIKNFAAFYSRNSTEVSIEEVRESSAGVHGWAEAELVLDLLWGEGKTETQD